MPMFESYQEFQKHYEGESDRSVAILAASFVEQMLEGYIRKKLVDSPAVAKLFDGYAPLTTFAAKIDMTFALGLAPTHVHDDLRTIKKLRNIFAHEADALRFDSPRVSDICSNFHKVQRSDGSHWELTSGKTKYLNAVYFCIMSVEVVSSRTSRLSVAKFRMEEVVKDDASGV